jgi:hypothetical protein
MSKIKSQSMTRTQIYIEPDKLLRAKIAAQSKGFNLSQYLRDLLDTDLQTQNSKPKNKHPKDIKVTSIGGPTVYYSRDHNDIYDY